MSEPQKPSESFFADIFGNWRDEFRSILENHRQDISNRLDRIERSLEQKSDKEHVQLLVTGIQQDLTRHAEEIDALQNALNRKMGTETMWKIIVLAIALASGLGGLIGFLVTLVLKK